MLAGREEEIYFVCIDIHSSINRERLDYIHTLILFFCVSGLEFLGVCPFYEAADTGAGAPVPTSSLGDVAKNQPETAVCILCGTVCKSIRWFYISTGTVRKTYA